MAYPAGKPLELASGMWTAVYCKPRQEKAFAWDLCRQEVTYFLPMIYRETSSGGRRRRNLYPIFRSYVFLAGGDRERLAAAKTNRVIQFVEIDHAVQAKFRQEIASLELALRKSPTEIKLSPHLAAGMRVLINGGPMKGVEGIVVNSGNPTRLWIGVTIMGAGASLEIHADLIEPLSNVGAAKSESTGTIEFSVGSGQTVAIRKSSVLRDQTSHGASLGQ